MFARRVGTAIKSGRPAPGTDIEAERWEVTSIGGKVLLGGKDVLMGVSSTGFGALSIISFDLATRRSF